MNKTAIKNYAIWARVQLIESAKQRAYEYEITENGENNPNLETIGGRLLSKVEKEQRQQLINQIRQKGYTQVMEEAAYTWFNRFIALRFMEVNGYLPTKIRVFTNESGEFKPEILKEALTIELDGLNREKIFNLLDQQSNEELYKYLLITQCNDLNSALPIMFEKVDNWSELLFPAHLLRDDSIVGQMVSSIPEEDWLDAVQIIGWMYQYYMFEPKEKLIKAKNRYLPNEIPCVTQLFTPDWIVRYMVENALGRLWYEGHPEIDKSEWKYYLDEAQQEQTISEKLSSIRKEYSKVHPEDIKVIDPCMGSGHILVYAFDVLMQIYSYAGWSERDAAKSIIENNLYGLDIDDRAYQLAYFAVMMKARKYNRRILNSDIKPNLFSIQDSSFMTDELLASIAGDDKRCYQDLFLLRQTFTDAKELGSIIIMPEIDFTTLLAKLDIISNKIPESLIDMQHQIEVKERLIPLVHQAFCMSEKYDVVVTNPPYMGEKYMPLNLQKYVKTNYSDVKSDLFSVFISRCFSLANNLGHIGLVTPYAWMFLDSYKKLRSDIIGYRTITSLVQLEFNAFEVAALPVCTYTFRNTKTNEIGQYVKLSSFTGAENQPIKLREAIQDPTVNYRFPATTSMFGSFPSNTVAYWASEAVINAFSRGVPLERIAIPRQGMATTDNDRFVRTWAEVSSMKLGLGIEDINNARESGYKWFPYNKGGRYRKWYGNNFFVVNYEKDGAEIKESVLQKYPYLKTPDFVVKNQDCYFKEGITWTFISIDIGVRYTPCGAIFDVAGSSLFPPKDKLFYVLGFMCSKLMTYFMQILNPTMNVQAGNVAALPLIISSGYENAIKQLSKDCMEISKLDWDSFENSWGFQRHPLVMFREEYESQMSLDINEKEWRDSATLISMRFEIWKQVCDDRFAHLKANEEELNRIFIDIYGLQNELVPEVEDKDVTIRKADLSRDIRGLISYAVGCILGRYSLDKSGLAFAGGTWDASQYKTYKADTDGILPITDDEYFDDDIVGMFVNWVRTVYGAGTLEENLRFIANALGGKGTPREVIRQYFLNDFYTDHLKIYQKRPIYWLFSSGKKNGFKCLIYMHRYQPDLLARIRTDYVHEQQERYRTQLQMAEDALQTAAPSERVKLNKRISKLKDQALELQKYEEKIHHLADQMIPIDLDDGVKVNYAKFQDVLEKIK